MDQQQLPEFTPSRFGGVALTGWIGTSPHDGGDFPFLLLYTTGGGDLGPDAGAAAFTGLLAAHGLRVGALLQSPEETAGVDVHVEVDHGLAVVVRLGAAAAASALVTTEWLHVARRRGRVFLTACARPYRGRHTLADISAFIEDPATTGRSAFAILPVRL